MEPLQHKFLSIFFLGILLCASAVKTLAHHSFAIYDFDTRVSFTGVVHTLKFKNPHITMTLAQTDEEGNQKIIDFVEGAPANMAARQGLKPEMIKIGTELTVVGSPRKTDDSQFFIRQIILENGKEWKW